MDVDVDVDVDEHDPELNPDPLSPVSYGGGRTRESCSWIARTPRAAEGAWLRAVAVPRVQEEDRESFERVYAAVLNERTGRDARGEAIGFCRPYGT